MNMKSLQNVVAIVISIACYVKGINTELVSEQEQANAAEPHRIAIIGGGIGGAATAYFLHHLTSGSALIDVYESGRIGGRLATTPVAGSYYETGGSILHPSNKYMANFVQELGLSRRADCPLTSGLFDGSQFVFRDSPWQAVTLARLFWRYGWDISRLNSANDDMLTKFENIYSLQSQGAAFRNTSALLQAIDPSFPALTQMSTREDLASRGVTGSIVDELVMAASLANFGQTPDDLHAFVGGVSVAGATPGLWSVAGGNRQVPELLLTKARASVLHRHANTVTVVTPETPPRSGDKLLYQVSSVEVSTSNEPGLYSEGAQTKYAAQHLDDPTDLDLRTQEYDAVIVATPLTADKTDIRFVNTSGEFSFPGEYERIIATLVQGKPRAEAFKLTSPDSVDEILLVNPDLVYNSLGLQTPVDIGDCSTLRNDPPVYKVFSPQPLTDEQLQLLFSEVNSTKVFDWRAYPRYASNRQQQGQSGQFELQPGLYHVNAVEWLGSAMEMSAIAAKNVALLALKHLTGDPRAGASTQPKDEL